MGLDGRVAGEFKSPLRHYETVGLATIASRSGAVLQTVC
jgi:hypothetical protein